MAPRYTAFVCSHTHWDREWYGTFHQFRYRLVRLIDNLLDLLDRDPAFRCFNLDGQAIILEDYLEIQPGQRPRLEQFIRQGRILIGPWYILPDEWLVSGESHIRNWMAGRDVCRSFGVEPPPVGYLPDMFGHVSQVPQILQGLGIDNTIFWRGLSGDHVSSELWWESPDGTRILGLHLPDYCGYCNLALFYDSFPAEVKDRPGTNWSAIMSDDVEFCATSIRSILDRLAATSVTGQLLLMNGVDHMEAQPQVPEILRRAAELNPEVEFRHATFQEYVQAVRANLPPDLQVIQGEQRTTALSKDSGAIIIQNILSSRIQLKQANARCQALLEHWVERFCTVAASAGVAYPAAFIEQAWRMLLRNHPHDSIGGCSIDAVHEQMEARFAEVEDLARVLLSSALHELTGRVQTDDLGEGELPYFVFNPLNWEVTDTVALQMDIEEFWLRDRGVSIQPDNVYRTLRNLRIRNWDGSPVDYVIHHLEYHQAALRPWWNHFSPMMPVVRVTLSIAVEKLPPLGYRGYRVSLPMKEKRLDNRHGSTHPAILQNEFLKAEIHGDGTLVLSGPAVGEQPLTGLHWFEDGGDNGDGYTYSPPRHDQVITSRRSRTQLTVLCDEPALQAVAVDYEMVIPAGLTPDRQHRSEATVPMKLRSVFRLGRDSQRLDVETAVINPARDHRLRVCFDVPDDAPDHHLAESTFDVVKRLVAVEQPSEEIWKEDEPLERPHQGYVSWGRLALAAFGLPEYEPVRDRKGSVLKLTLLRAVNWLGAGGHANTIVGGAGPHIETPAQQAIGRSFTFRYSILPAGPAAQRLAHQHNTLWFGHMSARHAGALPPEQSFVQVAGEGIVLSALKQVQGEAGLYILRFWNSGESESTARITWRLKPAKVWRANLAEVRGEELPGDGDFSLPVNPKEIVSLIYQTS